MPPSESWRCCSTLEKCWAKGKPLAGRAGRLGPGGGCMAGPSTEPAGCRERCWACLHPASGFSLVGCHRGNIQPPCSHLQHLIYPESSCWDKVELSGCLSMFSGRHLASSHPHSCNSRCANGECSAVSTQVAQHPQTELF